MTVLRVRFGLLALLACSVLAAQQPPAAAPNPGFDADACMRHCKEMGQARQKMMDERKAMMEKRDAAWKEIRAQVDSARNLKGEKKVAALESALEKLLAFHESMQQSMSSGMGMGMPMGPGMGMGMGMGMDCPMMGGMDHGAMGAMGHPMGAMQDCPMMHGEKPVPPARK